MNRKTNKNLRIYGISEVPQQGVSRKSAHGNFLSQTGICEDFILRMFLPFLIYSVRAII